MPLTLDTMPSFSIVIFSRMNLLDRCWDNKNGDPKRLRFLIPKFYFQSSLLNHFLLTHDIQSPFTGLVSHCFNYSLVSGFTINTRELSQFTFNQYFMYWIEKNVKRHHYSTSPFLWNWEELTPGKHELDFRKPSKSTKGKQFSLSRKK